MRLIPAARDAAKWQDAEGMVGAAMDRYGRIDILVNNAGVDKQDKGGAVFHPRHGGTKIGIMSWG